MQHRTSKKVQLKSPHFSCFAVFISVRLCVNELAQLDQEKYHTSKEFLQMKRKSMDSFYYRLFLFQHIMPTHDKYKNTKKVSMKMFPEMFGLPMKNKI